MTTICINGENRRVQSETVEALLRELDLLPSQAAVEHNGTVLFRHEMVQATLHEGDRIEIIRVVAGG